MNNTRLEMMAKWQAREDSRDAGRQRVHQVGESASSISMEIINKVNKRNKRQSLTRNTQNNMMKPLKFYIKLIQLLFIFQLWSLFLQSIEAQQLHRRQAKPQENIQNNNNVVAEMQVVCHSDSIVLMVNTNTPFNGMLYAKDAANNPDCLANFNATTNMSLRLPLKACGTSSAEMDDGIEFFNTIVVQPHMRLMTNQGKGYHIRCKYQTRERTIANTHFNVSAAFHTHNGPQTSTMPLLATASMPMCTMKIFRIDEDNVAESVKVGDKLVMVIDIDKQDMYGMRITNCVVRDGMNKAEQQLINDSGCPVDDSIMPKFVYELNNTKASVAFRAHKFPHTSSIYYQCNVRLCINGGAGGGCEHIVCPPTSGSASGAGGGVSAGGANSGGANVTNDHLTTASLTGGTGGSGSGGARLKRFIGQHKSDSGHQESGTVAAGAETETSATELPIAYELKADLKQQQQQQQSQLSFDVYSGLYVSDSSDMSTSNLNPNSNSNDPNGQQQVLPARRSQTSNSVNGEPLPSGQGNEKSEPCLTVGKASLLVALASLVSVALVVLIACQTGLIPVGDGGTNEEDLERQRRAIGGNYHHQRATTRRQDQQLNQQQQLHSSLNQSTTGRYHHVSNFNLRPTTTTSDKCLSSFYQFR